MLTLIIADPVAAFEPEMTRQYVQALVATAEVNLVGRARWNTFHSAGYHYTTMRIENNDDRYEDIVFVLIAGTPELGTCLNVQQYPEVAQYYSELLEEIRVMTDGVIGDYQFMHVMNDGRRVGTYSIVMRKNPFADTMAEALRKQFKVV